MTSKTTNRLAVVEAVVLLGVIGSKIKPRTMVVDAALDTGQDGDSNSPTSTGQLDEQASRARRVDAQVTLKNPVVETTGFFYALMDGWRYS